MKRYLLLVVVGMILGTVLGLVIVKKALGEQLMIEGHTEGQYIRCGNMKLNSANGQYKISDCKVLADLVDPQATPAPTAPPAPSQPLPVVTPKPTAKPESSSIPCESLGGLKSFAPDETKHFCFPVDGSIVATYPFFEIHVVNKANFSCVSLEATLFSPTGELLYYAYGVEPNTVGYRDGGGQFEEYVHLLYADPPTCNLFTFTQSP